MNTNGSLTRLGSKLHYWITGPESGTLVVLVHGTTLDHHTFDLQVPALVEAGYRIAILADDLKAILDQIGVEEAVLVGHSFGGFVIQDFAYVFQRACVPSQSLGAQILLKSHQSSTSCFFVCFQDCCRVCR